MSEYSTQERLEIVLNLRRQLQNFPTRYKNQTIDLYQDCYSCIADLKSIFRKYTVNTDNVKSSYNGQLDFTEIGMTLYYKLPISRSIQSELKFSKS